jgi:hypothetical protein
VYVFHEIFGCYAYGGKYETSALRHPIHRLVLNTVHLGYSDRPKLSEYWTDALLTLWQRAKKYLFRCVVPLSR